MLLAPVVPTKEPAGALKQTEWPVDGANEPVTQGKHVAEPSIAVAVPMAHVVAALAPIVSTKVPTDAC